MHLDLSLKWRNVTKIVKLFYLMVAEIQNVVLLAFAIQEAQIIVSNRYQPKYLYDIERLSGLLFLPSNGYCG